MSVRTALTLEKAIVLEESANRMTVVENAREIILDRTLFASRKRGRVASLSTSKERLPLEAWKSSSTSARGGGGGGGGELSAEAKFWKEKYEILKRERSEEEEDIEHSCEVTAEREAKLWALSRLLERKVDVMLLAGGGDDSEELFSKLEMQRKLLRFYELMTSMSVKQGGEQVEGFICTVKNKIQRTCTRFSISREQDRTSSSRLIKKDESLLFAPLANLELLPEYLRTAITCEEDMGPVMLGEILQLMYEDK